MSVGNLGHRLGNELYKFAFPVYRPLYSVFKKYTDRAERKLMAGRLSNGCVVVDVGANIGTYSQFFLRCVGPSGLVHSFEPDPQNFARLRVALSHFSNVRLNQLAVSDKTGASILYVSDDLNVDHRAYPTAGETRRTLSIESTTLDDYFRPGERVDLIKMDIQGFELHALRGAQRVLEDNPAVKLLLEFWPYGLKQAGGSAEAFVSFLADRDFSIFLPRNSGLVRCDRPPADSSNSKSYINLFAEKEVS